MPRLVSFLLRRSQVAGPGSATSLPRTHAFAPGDLQHVADQAERTIRQIGPVKVSLLAFAIGYVLARR